MVASIVAVLKSSMLLTSFVTNSVFEHTITINKSLDVTWWH